MIEYMQVPFIETPHSIYCEGLYSFLSLFVMREKEEKNKEEKKREERRNPYSCFVIIDHDSSMSLVNLTSTFTNKYKSSCITPMQRRYYICNY